MGRTLLVLLLVGAATAGAIWALWLVSRGARPEAFRSPATAQRNGAAQVEIEPAERAELESILRRLQAERESGSSRD